MSKKSLKEVSEIMQKNIRTSLILNITGDIFVWHADQDIAILYMQPFYPSGFSSSLIEILL